MITMFTYNPLATLLIVWCVMYFLYRIISCIIRHRNIVARGWPPFYCDADGDMIRAESSQPPTSYGKSENQA